MPVILLLDAEGVMGGESNKGVAGSGGDEPAVMAQQRVWRRPRTRRSSLISRMARVKDRI